MDFIQILIIHDNIQYSVVLMTLMLLDEQSVMLDEMSSMLVCNNSLSPND
jgi:hypothetical protein